MSRDSLLNIYLHRLVKNVVLSDEQNNGDGNPDLIEDIFEELSHLIQNSADSQSNYDLNQVVAESQEKISSSLKDSYLRTIEQLLKYKDSNTVAQYLILLDSIVNTAGGSNYDAQQQQQHNRLSKFPEPEVNPAPSRGYRNDTQDRASAFGGDSFSILGHGHQTVDSFENINFDRFSDRRSIYSGVGNNFTNQYQESRDYTFHDLLIPYFENQVSEQDILKYISYTLVGTTSDLFPLKNEEIEIPSNINNSVSGLLHVILEAGLIYQKLTSHISTLKAQRKFHSQIKTAVLSFLQDELSNYLNLVNSLSTLKSFTLKKLYSELSHEIVRLRFLYYIGQKSNDLNGNQILTLLNIYTDHGDLIIRKCANRFFDYTLIPFTKSITNWLVESEIKDSSDEFFIAKDSNDAIGIVFYKDKVPSFFSNDLAFKIYNIGLTNFFLKFHCKETKWTNSFSDKVRKDFTTELQTPGEIKFWNRTSVERLITSLHVEILNFFTSILYEKYFINDIIESLHSYLLMGKGDFIEAIVSNGEDLLSEPSNSLSGHQLTTLLKETIFKTTTRNDYLERPHVLNNLDARLLSIGHGNIGWDVFTLDFRVEPPLNFILNKNFEKKEYLKIFNHLWKIRRLDHLFEKVWRINKRKFSKKDKKFKRINLIQNFIHGFIKSIESYLFNGIINVKYDEFFSKLIRVDNESDFQIKINKKGDLKLPEKILKPKLQYLKEINQYSNRGVSLLDNKFNEFSIDEIIEIHSNFLSSIIKHKLINGSDSKSKGKISNKYYVNQLNNLINISFRFITSIKELNVDNDYDFDGDEDVKRDRVIYENLINLFNQFNGDLKVFVNDLSNDDDLELRYLGIILNQ